jgi:hypothetical protein
VRVTQKKGIINDRPNPGVDWRFDVDYTGLLAGLPQLIIPSMREQRQYALHANNFASWPVQVPFKN